MRDTLFLKVNAPKMWKSQRPTYRFKSRAGFRRFGRTEPSLPCSGVEKRGTVGIRDICLFACRDICLQTANICLQIANICFQIVNICLQIANMCLKNQYVSK